MQSIPFDPRYLDWVREGTKTRTTRYEEPVAIGPADLVFLSEPAVHLPAEVTALRDVPLADLDDDDAAAENFTDAEALREALRYHYPAMADDAQVTVVSFQLN